MSALPRKRTGPVPEMPNANGYILDGPQAMLFMVSMGGFRDAHRTIRPRNTHLRKRRLCCAAHGAKRHSDDVLQWPAVYSFHSERHQIQNDLHAGRLNDPRTSR